MKEHNLRENAKGFAEYITGMPLTPKEMSEFRKKGEIMESNKKLDELNTLIKKLVQVVLEFGTLVAVVKMILKSITG